MFVGCPATTPVDSNSEAKVPTGLPALTELETAVKEAYEREFGLQIPRPAIYNDPRSVDCNGQGHLTTTAYLGQRRLVMYLSRDGASVTFKEDERVTFPPAGTFRVLAVVVDYPATTRGRLALWEAAQAGINRHHAEFASRQGHGSPIVVFENTNVVIGASQIRDPQSDSDVISAVERQGISAQRFDIILSINIRPDALEGGFASGAFVYVGNYNGWQAPLTGPDMDDIAATAYHHEAGHIWG